MEKLDIAKEDKKVLRSMFWRSHLVFLGFNMAKMEANGFTLTMEPAIEKLTSLRYHSYLFYNIPQT